MIEHEAIKLFRKQKKYQSFIEFLDHIEEFLPSKELTCAYDDDNIVRNKHGYDISKFTKFDLPVKYNEETGKLDIIKKDGEDE